MNKINEERCNRAVVSLLGFILGVLVGAFYVYFYVHDIYGFWIH